MKRVPSRRVGIADCWGSILGEQAARFYEQYILVTTVRLCNLYGPWPGERTDLVNEVVAQMRTQGRARIWTRVPERGFIYVQEAARVTPDVLWEAARL